MLNATPRPLYRPEKETKYPLYRRLGGPQCRSGPFLRPGHRGPDPGRQIFRGGILKKSRLKYGMRKKRLSTRKKLKGDLYWKQCWYHSATEFSRSDATGARRSWGYCLLAASIIRAFGSVRPAPLRGGGGVQHFLGPRGVKYLNTGLGAVNLVPDSRTSSL
jgi:hypothetical protein